MLTGSFMRLMHMNVCFLENGWRDYNSENRCDALGIVSSSLRSLAGKQECSILFN